MKPWYDQHGHQVTFEQFIDKISESILANLIAFDRAGVRRGEVQQIIGKDGGTLIGAGAMLQTPVQETMTDEQGRALFDSYKKLLEAYDRGEIAQSVIADITSRNNTDKKTEMLRSNLKGQH
ncbi:MAG TPA: hypothetical protein VG944_16160 [Fimbriimonas sp.]|nr:hypothetical protein [Fimbriimonas sp.]